MMSDLSPENDALLADLTIEERQTLAFNLGCEFHDSTYGECASCASEAERVWDAVEPILAHRATRVIPPAKTEESR